MVGTSQLVTSSIFFIVFWKDINYLKSMSFIIHWCHYISTVLTSWWERWNFMVPTHSLCPLVRLFLFFFPLKARNLHSLHVDLPLETFIVTQLLWVSYVTACSSLLLRAMFSDIYQLLLFLLLSIVTYFENKLIVRAAIHRFSKWHAQQKTQQQQQK